METVTRVMPVTMPDWHVKGAILENQWGYEQTNIDYYRIVRRSGDWVTLQPLESVKTHDAQRMIGTCVPGADGPGKTFRRKLCRDRQTGEIRGCAIESYGWCRLWDGKPSHYSSYA